MGEAEWSPDLCHTNREKLVKDVRELLKEQSKESKEYTDSRIEDVGRSIANAINTLSNVGQDIRNMSEKLVELVTELKHVKEMAGSKEQSISSRFAQTNDWLKSHGQNIEKVENGIEALARKVEAHISSAEEMKTSIDRTDRNTKWWIGILFTLFMTLTGMIGFFAEAHLDRIDRDIERIISTTR